MLDKYRMILWSVKFLTKKAFKALMELHRLVPDTAVSTKRWWQRIDSNLEGKSKYKVMEEIIENVLAQPRGTSTVELDYWRREEMLAQKYMSKPTMTKALVDKLKAKFQEPRVSDSEDEPLEEVEKEMEEDSDPDYTILLKETAKPKGTTATKASSKRSLPHAKMRHKKPKVNFLFYFKK